MRQALDAPGLDGVAAVILDEFHERTLETDLALAWLKALRRSRRRDLRLLVMSAVMLPLFLPEGVSVDTLLRAQIAIILFAAAYIAETVRGGLQAIPKGQFEGADSIGLTYWQTMRLVILPQALKIVIPPMVGIFIAMFKDTSLVVIIGIFDLTQAAKAALADQAWRGFSTEVYVFISLIYFGFCFSMSKYSQSLEKRLATDHQR